VAKRRIKEWQTAITDRLRLDFQMTVSGSQEDAKYSVNLSGFVEGRWETLVRFDNNHEPPHRHTYHPDGSKDEHRFVAALPQTFFAQAQKDLMSRAEEYLEDYERDLGNMKWGKRV
jgi:hypothetical protein